MKFWEWVGEWVGRHARIHPHSPTRILSLSFSLSISRSFVLSRILSLSFVLALSVSRTYTHALSLSKTHTDNTILHQKLCTRNTHILHIDTSPNKQLEESAQQERTRLAVAGEGPAQNRFHRPPSVLHAPALLSCIRMLRHLPSALPAPLPLHSMTMLQSMHQKLEGI